MGWTARVRRDCRRRGGPPFGGADRAACPAANPGRRADGAGASRLTRDAFSPRLDRGRCPGITSVPLRLCRERTVAGTRNAAAARRRGADYSRGPLAVGLSVGRTLEVGGYRGPELRSHEHVDDRVLPVSGLPGQRPGLVVGNDRLRRWRAEP